MSRNMYRQIIIDTINKDYCNKDNGYFSKNVDYLIQSVNKNYKYNTINCLIESVKIFKDFITLSKENNWIKDYIPTLVINLNKTEEIEGIEILDINDLITEIDYNNHPEIMLYKKVDMIRHNNDFIEMYRQVLFDEFNYNINDDIGLNGYYDEDKDNYKIHYQACTYEDNNKIVCERKIFLRYVEDCELKCIRDCGWPKLKIGRK